MIQWTWPDSHGEDHCVITFGHRDGTGIVFAIPLLFIGIQTVNSSIDTVLFLRLQGDWLKDSGWALAQAELVTAGTAISLIHAYSMKPMMIVVCLKTILFRLRNGVSRKLS
jgi:hypothetical protein